MAAAPVDVKWLHAGAWHRFQCTPWTFNELMASILVIEPQFVGTLSYRDRDQDKVQFGTDLEMHAMLAHFRELAAENNSATVTVRIETAEELGGHISRECPNSGGGGGGRSGGGGFFSRRWWRQSGGGGGRGGDCEIKCYNCNGYGHFARDCRDDGGNRRSERDDRRDDRVDRRRGGGGGGRDGCYNCGGPRLDGTNPNGATKEAELELLRKMKQCLLHDRFQSESKNCVVVIHEELAVTFRHGTHENIKIGERLEVYDEAGKPTRVVCVHISTLDYIIYRIDEGETPFKNVPKTEMPKTGMSYVLLGFPLDSKDVHVVDGVVSAERYGQLGVKQTLGSSGSSPGYSGGPVFSKIDGSFLGIVVSGPLLDNYFGMFYQTLNLADLMHGSKNATYCCIIPAPDILTLDNLQLAFKNFTEWSGVQLQKKREELMYFLKDVQIGPDNVVLEVAQKLLDKGYSRELLLNGARRQTNNYTQNLINEKALEERYKDLIYSGLCKWLGLPPI